MAHPLKRHVVRAICASATTLLVNSRAAKADVERNVATRTPINVVYHGFPVGPSDVASPRETLVLSVGNISRESLSRKGHAAFVKAATLVPGAQFVLVGQSTDGTREDILRTAPPNLSLPGFVSDDELQRLYARASVYVQVSMHEGFGCSLAEAMAAGCIPVISGYGALPEVTGGHGHQVDDPDPRHVADAVRAALQERDPDRRSISEYVLTTFALERRQEALLALVDTLGTGGAAAQRPQVARRPSAPDS
jgi:glycosyltransferase involved in cell wall biosynthesis